MMNPGHIDAVFIAGKVRKWRGKLVGADMARVMGPVTESRDDGYGLWWRRPPARITFGSLRPALGYSSSSEELGDCPASDVPARTGRSRPEPCHDNGWRQLP
jgi:hypothetical protein